MLFINGRGMGRGKAGYIQYGWVAGYVWFIMNLEYHFELVFLRLVLKRNVLSESKLRITLL